MKISNIVLINLLAFSFSCVIYSNAFASAYDYGDAVGYTQATHDTNEWQQLGSNWTREYRPLQEDDSDDGVSWSTDNGINYGNEAITAGDTVIFKFDLYKTGYWGNYAYDQVKAWMDWDQDFSFDESSDIILQDRWNFREHEDYLRRDNRVPSNTVVMNSFYSTVIIPESIFDNSTEDSTDLWLRARAVCTYDYPNINNFYATSYAYQGEVEDYRLTINRNTTNPNPVAEPSSIFLIGLCLAFLGLHRRKRI